MHLGRQGLDLVLEAECVGAGLRDSLKLHLEEGHVGGPILRHLDMTRDLIVSQTATFTSTE